jgi:phosphoribosylamine---glycine ligase
MRVLGIGEYNSLGDLYWRLQQRGHEVRVYVGQSEAHGIFGGMLERVPEWRDQLNWIGAAGDDGFIVFESTSSGALQDDLRAQGYQVIGGSAWGDRIENDRAFGQQAMRDAGMQTAATYEFSSFDAALDFLQERPGRYVYKLSDSVAASTNGYIGELEDGADLSALLTMERRRWSDRPASSFVLMQFLQGVEVGVGAFFNGAEFLTPAVLDWEHKRFFTGDLGELTGEMGTVVTYRGGERIFAETLARIAAPLRASGYVGYINLNTIVNQQGIWPLEFTCRFGYPGFAICDALHRDGWDDIFRKLLNRSARHIETEDGFAVGVVLTVPPFPYEYGYQELSKGVPILFRGSLSEKERDGLHFGEVALSGQQLVTSGSLGYVMVVTGCGADAAAAQQAAYGLVRKVVVPKMRYRTDIGDRFLRHDQAALRALGYLD